MTNEEAHARVAQFPHQSAETVAYYNGRSGTRCEFTDPALIESFNRGRRHVQAEDRLSADTEWDGE